VNNECNGWAGAIERIVPAHFGWLFSESPAHELLRFPFDRPGKQGEASIMSLDTVGAGIGLGFVQGLTVGVILAVIMFALHSWRERRSQPANRVEELAEQVRELQRIVVGLQAPAAADRGKGPWKLPLGGDLLRPPRAFVE
jgi:hypothetical protein